MDKNLSNFPLLFERIGDFLTQFNDLREKRLKLSPEAFAVEFDKFVKSKSPVDALVALEAFNEIYETIYLQPFAPCSAGGPRMRA